MKFRRPRRMYTHRCVRAATLFAIVSWSCSTFGAFAGPQLVSPIKVLSMPSLEDYYPDAARRTLQTGLVVVKLCISAAGDVADAEVAKSSGVQLLDKAALDVVRAGTYSPARTAKHPVPSCAALPVRFELHDAQDSPAIGDSTAQESAPSPPAPTVTASKLSRTNAVDMSVRADGPSMVDVLSFLSTHRAEMTNTQIFLRSSTPTEACPKQETDQGKQDQDVEVTETSLSVNFEAHSRIDCYSGHNNDSFDSRSVRNLNEVVQLKDLSPDVKVSPNSKFTVVGVGSVTANSLQAGSLISISCSSGQCVHIHSRAGDDATNWVWTERCCFAPDEVPLKDSDSMANGLSFIVFDQEMASRLAAAIKRAVELSGGRKEAF